jgi:hypothetical protein
LILSLLGETAIHIDFCDLKNLLPVTAFQISTTSPHKSGLQMLIFRLCCHKKGDVMKLSQFKDSTILRMLFIGGVVATIASCAINPAGASSPEWLASLLQGLGAEMLGAAVTFLLIDLIFTRRREQEQRDEALKQEKEALIGKLRSRAPGVAIRAGEELREKRWLVDGTLKGIDISGADLQKVDLSYANLENVDLWNANLQHTNLTAAILKEARLNSTDLRGSRLFKTDLRSADLTHADLRGANLECVNLENASLDLANLQGANLAYANLQKTDLYDANLQKARLGGANLQNANLSFALLQNATGLEHARLNEFTRLPDETFWTHETDIKRFTDPKHPNFHIVPSQDVRYGGDSME